MRDDGWMLCENISKVRYFSFTGDKFEIPYIYYNIDIIMISMDLVIRGPGGPECKYGWN